MSRRDGSNYFDALAAPGDLRPWFGRPSVSGHELVELGKDTLAEIGAFVDDDDGRPLLPDTVFVPVSVVWPMGFSWPSFVARSTTLEICCSAGVSED